MRNLGWALAGLATFAAGALSVASTGVTYGSLSASQTIAGNNASAGVWTTDPAVATASATAIPAACGDPNDYADVVFGTDGDDVLNGNGQRQLIIGLGTNTLIACETQP